MSMQRFVARIDRKVQFIASLATIVGTAFAIAAYSSYGQTPQQNIFNEKVEKAFISDGEMENKFIESDNSSNSSINNEIIDNSGGQIFQGPVDFNLDSNQHPFQSKENMEINKQNLNIDFLRRQLYRINYFCLEENDYNNLSLDEAQRIPFKHVGLWAVLDLRRDNQLFTKIKDLIPQNDFEYLHDVGAKIPRVIEELTSYPTVGTLRLHQLESVRDGIQQQIKISENYPNYKIDHVIEAKRKIGMDIEKLKSEIDDRQSNVHFLREVVPNVCSIIASFYDENPQ